MNLKKLPAVFYAAASGNEPVREWLKGLTAEDRRTIGQDMSDVEYGWPIGMPLCKTLGQGIYEVRSTLRNGRIARVMFCVTDRHMVLLHGFIKKTQKTPQPDLALAIKRKKEVT